MGSLLSVTWQAIVCPVTTMLTLSIVWIWVKLFLQEWDPRHFSLSYADCVQRKQYWRALLAPMSHNSLWVLMVNVSTLWNFRHIEHQYGIFFFLRYSILLCITECALTFVLIHYSMKIAMGPVVRQTLSNLSTMGSSGLVLAWVSFNSVMHSSTEGGKYFVLFGLFNIHPTVAPIIMVAIYYMFLPHTHALSNLTGLTSGYLLAGGFLQFLPGFYWSLCFLFNVAVVVAASVIFRDSNASALVDAEEENEDVLEVVEIGPLPRMLGGPLPSSHDLRDLLTSTDRSATASPDNGEESRMEEGTRAEDNDETESTPLLNSDRDRPTVAGGGMYNRNRVLPAGASTGSYLSHLLDGGSASASARHNPPSPRRLGASGMANSTDAELDNV